MWRNIASHTISRLYSPFGVLQSNHTPSQLPSQAFLSSMRSRVERVLELVLFFIVEFLDSRDRKAFFVFVLLQDLVEAEPHLILPTQVLPLRSQVFVQLIDLLSD